MLPLTSEQTQEQQNIELNAAEINITKLNSSDIATTEPLQGTPFNITGNEDRGYFITAGPYKLTETKPTIEEAINCLTKEPWMVTFNLIATMIEISQNPLPSNPKP